MKWRQNTQVIALLHTKTPPSCCVNSQLDYEQSLELFSLSVDFNARKRETARSLAYNWRQAQFSALKGYMYIMGEKQTGHFLLQKLSLIISISMASHLVPLWTEACGNLEMAHWFSCLPFLTFRLSTYKFSKLISIYFLKEWVESFW